MLVRVAVSLSLFLLAMWLAGACIERIVGAILFVIGFCTAVFCRQLAQAIDDWVPWQFNRKHPLIYCVWGIGLAAISAHTFIYCQW